MIALIIGNLIGAFIMYFLGTSLLTLVRRVQKRGPKFFVNTLGEITSAESMDKTQSWFNKWGVIFVLFSRFSAGIRFFVSIIAGITRMNLILFTSFFTLGVILWNTLLLAGGYALGKQWHRILEWLRIYNFVVIIIIIIGIILFVLYKNRRKLT